MTVRCRFTVRDSMCLCYSYSQDAASAVFMKSLILSPRRCVAHMNPALEVVQNTMLKQLISLFFQAWSLETNTTLTLEELTLLKVL